MTLSDRWTQLLELAGLSAINPEFLEFVIKHIDASADEARLRSIAMLSSRQCLAKYSDLCRRLLRAAETALKELR